MTQRAKQPACLQFRPSETAQATLPLKRRVEAVLMGFFPGVYGRIRACQKSWWRRKIEPLLNQSGEPDTRRAEADFDRLQRYPEGPGEYGYSPYDVWSRGAARARHLLERFSMETPGSALLEVGCGDGMTASELAGFGHAVTITDMDDWRDPRVNHDVRFVPGVIEDGLAIPGEHFDLVYSFNTFEHLRDPAYALREMLGWCRVGGFIYLDFGPLFASAWGLHAYRTLNMPYSQFLFSEGFTRSKLRELGIRDLGVDRDDLQPLNRRRLSEFRRACEESGGKLIWWDTSEILRHLRIIQRYPEAFRGRGLTFEDVTTALLRVVVRKPAAGS